jgi:hypothetical protein
LRLGPWDANRYGTKDTYLIATAAALLGAPGPLAPGPVTTLDVTDPRLVAAEQDSVSLWDSALGQLMPIAVSWQVATLPAGELGETRVTAWTVQGVPSAVTIVVSPDADGHGWYVGLTPDGAFQSLSPTVLQAAPNSSAYGRYDLLTTLLHELGHVAGFMPEVPDFETHVQTVGGRQEFVAPGLSPVLVDLDQELDPTVYSGDLMSATLAPGVRELPSALDVQILDVVNGWAPPAPPASVIATPAPPTAAANPTLVDHAVAALAGTPPAMGPLPEVSPASQPTPAAAAPEPTIFGRRGHGRRSMPHHFGRPRTGSPTPHAGLAAHFAHHATPGRRAHAGRGR